MIYCIIINKMRDIFQIKDGEFAVWYNTFANKCTDLQTLFPNILTVAAINQIETNKNNLREGINYISALKNYANAVAEVKRRIIEGNPTDGVGAYPTPPVPPVLGPGSMAGIKAWTRSLIRQIKVHPNYSRSVGEALDIVSARPEPRDPTLAVRLANPGSVELRVGLGGRKLAVIEGRRNGSDWEVVGYSDRMRFMDLRPNLTAGQAEYREYRAQAYERNQRVGGYSPIVGVSTLP